MEFAVIECHQRTITLMEPVISSGGRETMGLHRKAIVSGQRAVKPVNIRLSRKKCRSMNVIVVSFLKSHKKQPIRKVTEITFIDLHYRPEHLMGAAFSSGSRETVDLHREVIVSGQCAVRPVNTGFS